MFSAPFYSEVFPGSAAIASQPGAIVELSLENP
jgi:hypothetical protein